MKQNDIAANRVTIDIDYDRPYFLFPDLSSPEGNPIEYFKMAGRELYKAGFHRESQELQGMMRKTAYADQFNMIARFLDFHDTQVQQEDDDYIYVKIRKNKSSIIQPRHFDVQDLPVLQNMVASDHDFSEVNCYGRLHAHYIKSKDSLEYLFNENEKHQWFELFSLDQFNSTLLHGRQDMDTFAMVLDKMYQQSPDMVKLFLYGENCFGKNALGEFLEQCDFMFSQKEIPSQEKLKSFSKVISLIGKIDPEKKSQLIGALSLIEKENQRLQGKNFVNTVLKEILDVAIETTSPTRPKSKL